MCVREWYLVGRTFTRLYHESYINWFCKVEGNLALWLRAQSLELGCQG